MWFNWRSGSNRYQTISKDRAAGAVSIINAAEIQNRPSVNIISAMDGMFTGLRVYGDGGTEKLTIRGISTMTMGISNPLVVVDGFAVEDGLESVNPNDVETVHILRMLQPLVSGVCSSTVLWLSLQKGKRLHVKFNSLSPCRIKLTWRQIPSLHPKMLSGGKNISGTTTKPSLPSISREVEITILRPALLMTRDLEGFRENTISKLQNEQRLQG